MSVISMETGSSNTTAAKAFFSISLAILIYENRLSKFLIDDLQIMIFWTGAILLGLSVIPVVKGIIQLGTHVFLDRKLPNESFTFWETLNRPQWENFLNDVIGDLYLLVGFIILFVKIGIIDRSFIDQSPSLIHPDIINTIIPLVCLIFCVIILVRLVRRIRSNKFHIELSQHFLTINKTQGSIDPETRDHYINRNWHLFETSFKKAYYSRFLHGVTPGIKQLISLIKTGPSIRDHKENIGWFGNLKAHINNLKSAFNRSRMQFHQRLARYDVYPLLGDLNERLGIIQAFYGELIKTGFNRKSIPKIFMNPPSWNFPSTRHIELIHISVSRAGLIGDENMQFKKEEEFNEQWIASLHTQLEQFMSILEELSMDWSQYCEKNSIS